MTTSNTDTMAQEPVPGTREALVEVLALDLYDMQGDGIWPEEDEATRETYRVYARALSGGVVDFVQEWLLRPGNCVPWLAREWREEMAP
jgi:hypothetical protein